MSTKRRLGDLKEGDRFKATTLDGSDHRCEVVRNDGGDVLTIREMDMDQTMAAYSGALVEVIDDVAESQHG